MGRTTDLGEPLCSDPGKESWGRQEGSAPEEATEKLLEETRDGCLLLFLVGVCCSSIAVIRDILIGRLIVWSKSKTRKMDLPTFQLFGRKC